jgi:hypothetical protein
MTTDDFLSMCKTDPSLFSGGEHFGSSGCRFPAPRRQRVWGCSFGARCLLPLLAVDGYICIACACVHTPLLRRMCTSGGRGERRAGAGASGLGTRQVEEQTGKIFPVPDFTIEHWGVYEARRLAQAPPGQFRAFVLRAFGALPEGHDDGIHGYKGAIPVWVGEANQKKGVTAQNVQDFSNAIRKTLRYKQDNLRDGIMLAWAFRPDATEAAERLRCRRCRPQRRPRCSGRLYGSPRFPKRPNPFQPRSHSPAGERLCLRRAGIPRHLEE